MCHEACHSPVRGGAGIVEERVEVPGSGAAIPAFVARPEGEKAPAVVILHDIHGANAFYHDVARRLAGEGFVAVLPDLFVREGALETPTREAAFARAARHDQVRGVQDIANAITWLRGHEATTGKVGVVGFCMGGTYVMLAAAREPLPEAGVAFYGFPAGSNRPLSPLVPMTEVAEVRAPLLGLWGDQDVGVGMDNVAAYDEGLTARGAEHEFVIYPGLPHGFLTFDPASPNYDNSQDAWARTLAFFRAKLGG
jgi:carboxymethylenebutenolidase